MPIDITFRLWQSTGTILPSGVVGGSSPTGSPSMPGMLGPRMSASTSPILPPICWSADARFTLTVDLPTPPLPLPTAMTWRIPGSFSEPADAWDNAPGACWSSSCGSVVCIPRFLSFSPARWLLPHLDLDVGSRHANAVSHNGSLGRRTYDFARPNSNVAQCQDRSLLH